MRQHFYPKLAFIGMVKNKKFYLPYLLTCLGMVAMYYIVSFLSTNQTLADTPGGGQMQAILGFGCGVIAVFAFIFLFYTNSFLLRRRKKEFGLYNILGMNKKNLAHILAWECLFTALLALLGGIFCGMLFAKLGELLMVHILAGQTSFSFSIDPAVIGKTVLLFGVIFGVIFLNALRQIHLTNPIALLHSEALGEKPPKANWLLAILGLILLLGAYYLAVTIQDPLSTLLLFFVAVIMVILATYLLFIAGSVVMCKLLQKRKKYYYKANHFVSISSMIFRMKRNGAGLASICILSTMVLVMISSTSCLYIGSEDSLSNQYPRDITIKVNDTNAADTTPVQAAVADTLAANGMSPQNQLRFDYLSVSAYAQGDTLSFDYNKVENYTISDFSNLRQLYIVPLADYNRLMGTSETLNQGEMLLYAVDDNRAYDGITIEGVGTWHVKKTVQEFAGDVVNFTKFMPALFLIVPDDGSMAAIDAAQQAAYGQYCSYQQAFYGFDLACEEAEQIALQEQLERTLKPLTKTENPAAVMTDIQVDSAAAERSSYYALYGSLFFLGVLLGLVFVLGAILMIYYKQVTEGYEDQGRYEIFQKVGMSRREIKRSIHSQVLTVFFLPLLAAGVHMAFAFPMVQKLLLLFGLSNTALLVAVTVGCYLLFALFYVMVYLMTSKAYYGIVTSQKESVFD